MSTQGKQWMLDSALVFFRLNGSMPMGRLQGLPVPSRSAIPG